MTASASRVGLVLGNELPPEDIPAMAVRRMTNPSTVIRVRIQKLRSCEKTCHECLLVP